MKDKLEKFHHLKTYYHLKNTLFAFSMALCLSVMVLIPTYFSLSLSEKSSDEVPVQIETFHTPKIEIVTYYE